MSKKVNEIIKDISTEYFKSIAAGQPQRMIKHQNGITKTHYNGFNQLVLSRAGFSNPNWLTFKQSSSKGGKILKGSKSQPIFLWAKSWKFKMSDGKNWSVTTYSEIEAKQKAKDKDPAAVLVDSYGFFKFYKAFNAEQTDILEQFPPAVLLDTGFTPKQAKNAVMCEIPMIKTVWEQRLICLIGASFLTTVTPDPYEISLIEAWLNKLNESPYFLWTAANTAEKAVRTILDQGRVAA